MFVIEFFGRDTREPARLFAEKVRLRRAPRYARLRMRRARRWRVAEKSGAVPA